ncbi:vestigial like 4 like [Cololabis saira]|uniref:vestigial like 4 like n=1 Tax=Cololabis saira TaxID=129043 RepID=UPI002AD209A1|nr:vestigial like 4 like [Cololabis saira]
MAVANFQYITRMSSGFKVYVLEGQPHLRCEDRYRAPVVYPVKRKRSHERGLTLEERRERAVSKSIAKVSQRAAPAAFSRQQSTASSQSPTSSPTSLPPTPVYYTPMLDEPLALVKKPRKDTANTEEKTKSPATSQIQMRPSVITCVSSLRNPSCRSDSHRSHSSAASKSNYDNVLEEHFQRSLGPDYQQARAQQLSISVSVDDHFAKALGDKWLQIKSKSSSCSSTPPSSPSVTHSPTYSHSPNQYHKESTSSSLPPPRHWSVN